VGAPGDRDPRNRKDDDGDGYVDNIVGYDFVDQDGTAFDRDGHGTHAAGVIGAVHNNGIGIKGVCPSISILPIRYLIHGRLSPLVNMKLALEFAYKKQADVILLHTTNFSANPKKEGIGEVLLAAVREALEKLAKRGVAVVASAGNRNHHFRENDRFYRMLASFPNTIVVTATTKEDTKAFLANYGMEVVDTAAPGSEILTTDLGGGYKKAQGTLMAAAHVAGALALAVSKHHGHHTASDYRQALISKAGGDFLAAMELQTLGQNRLNVEKFLGDLK